MKDIRLKNIYFSYTSSLQPLFENINLHFSRGWTGIIGANGSGKTTLLHLITGRILPDKGTILKPNDIIYCSQKTDDMPEYFKDFVNTNNRNTNNLKSILHIEPNWFMRWATLSKGEQKKAQIGIALYRIPEVLALDEPTNHVDGETKDTIMQALKSYQGIGLLISHDRHLLDLLCSNCLFIEPPTAILRRGNYTQGKQAAKNEQQHAYKQRAIAKKNLQRLKREAIARRQHANQANKKRSKKGLALRDSDGREKRDRARLTGKDSITGKLLNQLRGKIKQSEKKLNILSIKKIPKLNFWLTGEKAKSDLLLSLPQGEIKLSEKKILFYPEIEINPSDKIALTGNNGYGKTSLINIIIENIKTKKILYLPQEISKSMEAQIIDKIKDLSNEQKGHLFNVVAGLGSTPVHLLNIVKPSPGELRKLFFALYVLSKPHLIIMDEPTNHMDLPSIELLEKTLTQYSAALLLVSHDKRFLQNTTEIHWHIVQHKKNHSHLYLKKI